MTMVLPLARLGRTERAQSRRQPYILHVLRPSSAFSGGGPQIFFVPPSPFPQGLRGAFLFRPFFFYTTIY